jgi:Zn-dependent protease with chaperone function
MAEQTQGPGTYFDGTSGVPHSVTVTIEENAIAITSPEGTPLARWDYPALERFPAPEHRLRLGLAASPSTARLEVRDPAFAEAVKERLDFRTVQIETSERRSRHRVVEWSIAAFVAVLLIGVVGMPALTELLLPFIPRSAEIPIGAAGHEETKKSFNGPGSFECGDAGDQERAGKAVFLKMFGQMEAAADLGVELHPFVIRTRVVNAIAMPGGYVHVYDGIIQDTASPDELAGVIGHELGHVAHRDTMRRMLHTAGLSYLFGVALGDVTGSGGMITAALQVLGNQNTRSQEAAADQFGAALLRKLGADPYALANVFERWSQQNKPSRRMLILYDHPADAQRVAAIRATPAVANPKPLLTAEEWQALKQVCSGK